MELIDEYKGNPRFNVRKEASVPENQSCVVYWMQRSQRAFSNQALDTAVNLANRLSLPLAVVFNLVGSFQGSTERHYRFMLKGLHETEKALEKSGAGFFVCETDYDVHAVILRFVRSVGGAALVSDENPLRITESWRERTAAAIGIPFLTVDSDVIVPSSIFSREEYSAKTLRVKIKPLVDIYLENLPGAKPVRRWNNSISYDKNICARSVADTVMWKRLFHGNPENVKSGAASFTGGRSEALEKLSIFTGEKISSYSDKRNLPEADATSRLSPYLHFGQISPSETAAAVITSAESEVKSDRGTCLVVESSTNQSRNESVEAFLEQLIVRRELAINFVKHNSDYDSFDGLHGWAKKTLTAHSSDMREYVYTLSQFENGETHDDLWNAAQHEMTETGFMHGYLRMYWAKKILEWTKSPEEAFDTAIYLNDKYQLDGRDPNGYTGIAWALGGKHDRPWGPERKVFGLIRYMNYNGMKRKFDTSLYISKFGKNSPG